MRVEGDDARVVVGKGDREIREGGRFILTISDKERAFDKERA